MTPRRTFLSVALAAVLGLTAAGCGTDDANAGPADTPRGFSDFDLVVVASEKNDPLAADLYAIKLDPLTAVRITTDKKVSTVAARGDEVVVAAADGRVDQLALVATDGVLNPIPDLGRPFAYNPSFVDDRTLMFDDVLVPEEGVQVNRTVTWDDEMKLKSTLFQTDDNLVGSAPGPDGQVALVKTVKKGQSIVVRDREGATKEIPIEGNVGAVRWGTKYISIGLNAAKPIDGDPSIATILLDPDAGRQLQLGGSQPIAWNPDGSKLLVRKTGDGKSSALAMFDPTNPDAIEAIGTVTGLVIYSGAWLG